MADAIQARIEEKRLGATLVLSGLDISVAAGEFVAVTGPSGVGKSTLLGLLAGLDRRFCGRIETVGRIGMVFQDPRLLPWRSAAANIALAAPDLEAGAIDAALTAVGLAGQGGLYPRQMSLGMARRVALARALAVAPDILLLDEPFVSLDAASADLVRGVVRAYWHSRNPAVVMVTHDAAEAETLAGRVIRLG